MNCLSFFMAISLHLGLQGEYNSVHPHARCDLDSWMFGSYYNSEYKISNYIGKEFNGLELGLVTGYQYDVVPMIRYKKDIWFIAPSYEVSGNTGMTIGVEVKL